MRADEGHIQPRPGPAPRRSRSRCARCRCRPPPEAREPELRYSVVVANQPVRDVLLAMARETQHQLRHPPRHRGHVNLNAIDQTLKQILTRIAQPGRRALGEPTARPSRVMPDTPYLRTYRVDYVNMARDVTGTIGVQSQVVSPAERGGQRARASSQNSSLLKVDNVGAQPLLGDAREEPEGPAARDRQAAARGQQRDLRADRGQRADHHHAVAHAAAPRGARPPARRAAPPPRAPGETQTHAGRRNSSSSASPSARPPR